MAIHITIDCINCGACEPECPTDAISDGPDIYVIDPELCTECLGTHGEVACQSVCPVECCVPDPDHAETTEELWSKAQRLFPGDAVLLDRDAAAAAAQGARPISLAQRVKREAEEARRREYERLQEEAEAEERERRSAWVARRNAREMAALRKGTSPAPVRSALAGEAIERAAVRFKSGDARGSMRELCKAWGATADGEVGEVVRAWAERRYGAIPPSESYSAGRARASKLWWAASAARAPIDRVWAACPTFVLGNIKEMRARALILERRMPDPVLVGTALAIAVSPPRSAYPAASIYTPIFSALSSHGDTLTLKRLEEANATPGYERYIFGHLLPESIERLRLRLDIVRVELTSRQRKTLRSIGAAVIRGTEG